ncbi:MAG TPA: TVP38/TMEM64 family protein [Methylomirabilota bacterium]|nr:TVP38/TMEM64 family protein [Methylomirabilota bacterium]
MDGVDEDAAARASSSMSSRIRWGIAIAASALVVGYCAWLVWTDAPAYQFLVRLYVDKHFLKRTLREWGVLAPVIFIALQALQVIISPIPGEATGILGGYLFGQWLGLLYSTIGLTMGSVVAFAIGRWLGAHYVKNFVSEQTWNRLGFIVEAEGAVLCFIIFLIPGLPKDIVCYLFGISPMPLWVFALVSGLGRIPGTWVLSAQGAHTAAGDYYQAILVTAVAVAVALPLYYYRHRIMTWFQGRTPTRSEGPRGGLDNDRRDS